MNFNIKLNERKYCETRKGATAVEFALTFPIVLAFFLAMISLTQIYLLRSTSELAAYAGAREGIVVGSNESDIRQETERVMQSIGAQIFDVQINRSAQYVEVVVSVPMDGNSWATCQYFPSSFVISNSCRLRRRAKK